MHDSYTMFSVEPRSGTHYMNLSVYAHSHGALHLPSFVTNRYPLSPSWLAILAATTIKWPRMPWCSSVACITQGAFGLVWRFTFELRSMMVIICGVVQ